MQKFLTSSLRFRFFVMAITRGRCPIHIERQPIGLEERL